jgi:hypothetical protein
VTFRHGELFERSFQAAGGVVEVLAEILIDGHRLELRDIAIYPRGVDRVPVAPTTLLGWVREVADEARREGFREVRLTAMRLSGRRRGRRVDFIIRLDEGRS